MSNSGNHHDDADQDDLDEYVDLRSVSTLIHEYTDISVVLEQQLRRVKKPEPVYYRREGVDRTYRGVGTLYLEDLIAIYQAVNATQEDAFFKQAREFAEWESRQQSLQRRYEKSGDEYHEPDPPYYITDPIIELKNEEFEFDNLQQVTIPKRLAFSEFDIDTKYSSIHVSITGSGVHLETRSDDPIYQDAVRCIDQRIARRTNQLVAFMFNPWVVGIWWAVPLVWAIVVVWPGSPFWFTMLYILSMIGGWGSRIWYHFAYSRRKRVIVPQYEADVQVGFWNRHGMALGFWVAVLTLIVSLVTFVQPLD